ncbi:MAG: response regulator [Polyangiaceae bacterium]|nr:response regulator [Polyangiaceae bacterium]
MSEKKQLGKILLQQRALSGDQLKDALGSQKQGRLASHLAHTGVISETDALKGLSEQHGIPGIDLGQVCINLEHLDLVPREIAEKHQLVPVLIRDERIFVALANPGERNVVDELEFVTGKKVYCYVALATALAKLISEAYARKAQGEVYYVGPRCPADVLQKLGIDRAGKFLRPTANVSLHQGFEVEENPPAADEPVPGGANLVMSDSAQDLSSTDGDGDDGFGDTSRELSVVTALPEHELESAVSPGTRVALVVDDETEIRKLVRRLLESRGFRVMEAETGLRALRMVKERTPDLIVLDAMLPEVHGFEIARRIKGSRRYGHIPIIMVSAVYRGWRYAEDLKHGYGVDHFLEKPFRIGDLLAAVSACFDHTEVASRESEEGLATDVERALEAGIAAYKAGREEEAIAHLERGLVIDPLAYRLHFHLGLLYGRRGKVYEAIRELETAVDINGTHFPAVKNLAILYVKAGFRNKASETWEKALTLAPDDATRQSIQAHLQGLV